MSADHLKITEFEALKSNFKAACRNLKISVDALHEAMKGHKIKRMQEIVLQQKIDLQNFNCSKRSLENLDPSGQTIKELSAEALEEVKQLREKNRINRRLTKGSLATVNRVFRQTGRSSDAVEFSYGKKGKLGNQKNTSFFINRMG
jgi:hypothetical protein